MATEPVTSIRLTALSHGAGCACKLGPAELAQVLRHVPLATDPRILVDASTRDDAAVFQLTADRALVGTVDFFTPIVDSAYDFGRIAAANALSDIYAMGATPLFTLSLVGWPRDTLPLALLGDVLRGGADVVRAAGAFILGGHSIDDPEPKFGMVAIGEVHPDRVVTNAGAKPGDILVLTKEIGTGVLTTALKRDLVDEADLQRAVTVMTTLNADAARAMVRVGVHAATDVTGFGLLGHLHNMLRASGVSAEIGAGNVRLLPRARELAERGAIPGGTKRNLESLEDAVTFAPDVAPVDRLLLCDAQTSGGLLIAVSPQRRDALADAFAQLDHVSGYTYAAIGTVRAGNAGTITVKRQTP
jgi:selenide,water dikinase